MLAASPTTNDIYIMLIAILGMVAVFAVVTVGGWAKQRRLEREAFYRAETERQLAERGQLTAADVAASREREIRERWLQRRERIKLGGFVLLALGAGMLIALRNEKDATDAGWIPLAIGAGALVYAFALYPASSVSRSLQPPGGERASTGT